MLAPVGDLLVQPFASKRVPLPHGEVGVLKGELRQAGCSLFDCGGVELTELPEQDLHRPSVGNDVMEGQRQDVISVRDPKQPGTQKWTSGEVEGTVRLLDRCLHYAVEWLGPAREVIDR